MNITFIAPPAAGKGTQSKKISKKYNLEHISTGDLLRNITDNSIKEKIDKGQFVSDEVISDLLKQKLKEVGPKGYVLDGFPRNINQAKLYEEMLKELNIKLGIIIVLDIDKEIALKRITGRRICPACGAVFNDLFEDTRAKIEGVCDNCGHNLVSRADDNEETFEKRYQIYLKETAPLIEYFKDNVYHVDSSINADYTFKQIEKIMGGVYDKY